MKPTPDLNEREQQILRAVVTSYITLAEPVGSRSVVKRFDLSLSPATVRNVMADLEEMGYLEQLHTSSGRVPTDKGYRYYVDYLMRVRELTTRERSRIEKDFTEKLNDADAVLRQTSHMLALITHQAGIAEAPGQGKAEVRRIELMPMNADRLIVLIVDNFGRVHTMTALLDTPLLADEMGALNRFLNEHLFAVPFDNLVSAVESKLQTFLDEQRRLAERALNVLNTVPKPRQGQLFLDGATQLFEQPEFKDVTRAREVFGLLEERDQVIGLLRAAVAEEGKAGRSVLIGIEGKEGKPKDISVVASPYRVGGKSVGMIGVLGPRRMPYSRLTAIVDYTAGMVGRILTRLGS